MGLSRFFSLSVNLLQALACAIFVGGIMDQATFGPDRKCLLFISNFSGNAVWFFFDANSSMCQTLLAFGLVGTFLGLLFLGINAVYLNKTRPAWLIFGMCLISVLWSVCMLVAASIATDGILKTCIELRKSGDTCDAVFSNGFRHGGSQDVYKRNFNVVQVAVGFGWIAFVAYAAYAFSLFRTFRQMGAPKTTV